MQFDIFGIRVELSARRIGAATLNSPSKYDCLAKLQRNPDGGDHWDVCRDVRYAKAKSGDLVEEVTEHADRIEKVAYWNGSTQPFLVMHSVLRKNQIKREPGDGGFIPLEQHQAHAEKHGYTVREFDTPI